MKNITVSLDDETYRRARVVAAERDTSVSALVKVYLSSLITGETLAERMKSEERTLRARVQHFRGGRRLGREELHRRKS